MHRSFRFFVQAHQDFGQAIQDAILFQIPSEFFLFGVFRTVIAIATIAIRHFLF
jgi:hypothetical protein